MIAAVQQHDLLPESVPTLVIGAGFVVLAAAWVALHQVKRKTPSPRLRALLFVVRVGVGFATLTAATQLALRVMLLTTSWALWPIALLGAALVEVLIAFYALERRTVSRRAGLTLAGLRVLLALLVLAMLAKPVMSWELTDEIQRYVAVLLDESASMRLADPQRSPAEKLRLAEMLSVPFARRAHGFESVGKHLLAIRQELSAVGEELALLAGADAGSRQRRLASRRRELNRAFAAAHETIERQLGAFAQGGDVPFRLDEPTKNGIVNARAELAVGVRDRLAEAVSITGADHEARLGEQYERLAKAVQGASSVLAKLAPKVAALAETLDEKLYASLSKAQRAEADAAAGKTRLELAREVLLHAPVADLKTKRTHPALLDRLQRDYRVKLYAFAGDCAEIDPAELRKGSTSPPASRPATAPATAPAARAGAAAERLRRTDLAGAIRKVMTEMSGKQLAGLVLLADGRPNAGGRAEPLAAQLGSQRVPVCPIVMGPAGPPCDAAVIALHAPETVCEKDKLQVTADLKLDGLAGRQVRVALYDAKRQVAEQTVSVPRVPSYRTRVQFSDEPEAPGLHAYRVEIKAQADEVFSDNNTYPLTVSVTKERTKLLVMEGRPRWEFRYVKNLFADRDRTVKLQYVLLEPDRIAGWKNRLKIPASASRPEGQVEATLLPASAQEWMKFDVIVLGDVSPQTLDKKQLETLRKFVTDRGGTLVVVVGPRYMPHAYAETPLDEILPMTFEPSAKPVRGAQKTGYRIALTPAGADSVVMRQKIDPEENLGVWQSVPEVYWRHPSLRAKEGPAVLAFAMPPSPPEFLRPLPPEKTGDEDLLRKREALTRQFQRDHALIAVHNVAAGRVMMLSFDRTWRLRYRVGDTYHHKFWGQVMRWATANKLPAGTDFVKLGTDRTRYQPDSAVRVRAKIVQPDLAPVVSKTVAVKVFAGEKLVLRKKLEYVKDSAGMYAAEIRGLPGGTYRVELQAPDAEPILAAEKVKKVATEFSVDPVSGPELVELSADRGLLGRLARLSGGVLLEPHEAAGVTEALGEKSLLRRERKELRLWDSWPLLILIVAVATCEWVLRKRIGLA